MSHLRSLIGFLERRERWEIAGLAVLLLVASLLEVMGVGIVLPFIQFTQDPDALLTHRKLGPIARGLGITDPSSALVTVGLVLIGFFIVKNAYLAFMYNQVYRFGFGKSAKYSTKLLREYMTAPYVYHLQQSSADLVRNATIEIQHVFATIRYALILATEGLVILGVVAVLWWAEPIAALVGIGLMGGAGYAMTRIVRRRLAEISRIRHREDSRRITWINRSFGGFKEAKLLGRERYFVGGFWRSSRALFDVLRRNSMINTYPRLVIETIAVVALVGFVVIMLASNSGSEDLFGVVALFGVATVRLIPSTRKIISNVNDIRFNLPAVESVEAEMRRARRAAKERPVPDASEPMDFESEVAFEEVSFQYPASDVAAVLEVDLTIERGESVAFVGRSGAGKTTLVDILLGLLVPTAGRVTVDGVDIHAHLRGWQRHIGYIPQAIFLSDDTILRNVAFGIEDEEIDEDAVWRALDAAQLGEFVRGLEGGLDTWVGDRGVRLSGGQRQRVGIARALYHDPDVLVLDEATSSLDTRTERELEAAIREVSRGKTLVVIAHRLSTVRKCDRIVLMADGRIEGIGTYDDLLRDNALFQQLVRGAEATRDLESVAS